MHAFKNSDIRYQSACLVSAILQWLKYSTVPNGPRLRSFRQSELQTSPLSYRD